VPHRRVDEAPAKRRVFDFLRAIKGGIGFAEHIGRARHVLDAPGNKQASISASDCLSGQSDRVETGSA
jgi:hypothetical protein